MLCAMAFACVEEGVAADVYTAIRRNGEVTLSLAAGEQMVTDGDAGFKEHCWGGGGGESASTVTFTAC